MMAGQKALFAAVLLLGLAQPLNTAFVVPANATVFDAQNGMGFGNNKIYDGTQYVNASDNSYARAAGLAGTPTWAQANFSLSVPAGAKVLNAMLELEHQQDAAGQITVNVSVDNGTGWNWDVCSFPPLSVANTDAVSYCNITGYVSANTSLVRIYLNMTYSSGTKRESIDSFVLNRTYLMPANLTGTMALSAPANASVLEVDQQFNVSGNYSLSCAGNAAEECGQTEVYAEYCAGVNCTDFRRVTNATDVHNMTANGISCGYLYGGGNCSGNISFAAAAKPGKYSVRISAISYSNNVYSQANSFTSYGVLLTGWIPPYSATCYDPVGGHGLYGCTANVNATDLAYAEIKYNPANQPGIANASFSFDTQQDAIIENVSMLASHVEDNPSNQAGTAYFWNGTSWQFACSLTMSASDHSDECALPLYYFANGSRLQDVLLHFEFNTSSGSRAAYVDFLGMRAKYKMPFVAQMGGSVGMDSPADRSVISPGAQFNISGAYSISCMGPAESECRVTRLFAEYCFGEGCTNFRRVDNSTDVFINGTGEINCGFLNGGQGCSGNFSFAARANAGKYSIRMRAASYAGDLFSPASTVTFPGTAFTPCTSIYSASCSDGGGSYDCTSAVSSINNVYANLRYTPISQPGWMNANLTFNLPRNSYITNVSGKLTHRIERADRQTGSEFVWNATGWQKVCDLTMITSDHTDTCAYPLGAFRYAYNLDDVRRRTEYYTTLGTSNAWIDYACTVVGYRVPLLRLDSIEYSLGGRVNISGGYWEPGAMLNISIYDGYGNLTHSAALPADTNGSFNYSWMIENVTIRKAIEYFSVNVTDIARPPVTESVVFGVRGCEAYVAEQDEPCAIQCPAYTNYTISYVSFEGDEMITSSFKVCHLP